MITKNQLNALTATMKTNTMTIYREYLQILFLSRLYTQEKSNKIFFKGGTAIHLLFKAPRFSEDLDFSVMLSEKEFIVCIHEVFKKLTYEEKIIFKERNTISGKRFLLTANDPEILPHACFINLDFSFREKIIQPEKSIIDSQYPVIFTSFVHHISAQEMCAEKIRALITRQKGRDLFDLWYLISKGASIDSDLVQEKLKFYKMTGDQLPLLAKRIHAFTEKDFIVDMKPFVPVNERDRLKETFDYITSYLLEKLKPS